MTLEDDQPAGAGQGSKTPFEERVSSYIGGKSKNNSLINTIGCEIVDGTFPPDETLPSEAFMLQRYSVSRTSLREAYSKLTAKGLLTARPKVGTTVRARTYWNMLDAEVLDWHLQTMPAGALATDLYALRRMVEPGAAELAAAEHTAKDILNLEAALRTMTENAANETELIAADLRFHLSILKATQNPFINAFSALIYAAMVSTFKLSWRGAEVMKATRLAQHAAVAEAIKAGNANSARALMEELLDDSIEDVVGARQPKNDN
jgi:DNA-binding FadR family transcriptional regulator